MKEILTHWEKDKDGRYLHVIDEIRECPIPPGGDNEEGEDA